MHQLTHTVSLDGLLPWLSIAGFGAYHGLNPAMGWLFALALGLQQNRERAIWIALLPVALGHAVSIAITALVVFALHAFIPLQSLQILTAVLLIGFGVYKFFNWYRHPRWVGMRVRWHELTGWSFLMATAHGAGLMIAPALLGVMEVNQHSHNVSSSAGLDVGAAVFLHTLSMLLVMVLIALLVYRKLGVMVLRKGWLNFDLIWAVALLVVGTITLVVAV